MIFIFQICFTYYLISSLMYGNTHLVSAEIFTSIEKMREIFFHERRLLSGIKTALRGLEVTSEVQAVLTFCQKRQEEIKRENMKESVVNIKHPNGVYLTLKHFANVYKNVRLDIERIDTPYLRSVLQDIPSSKDLHGARQSILRLQEVYAVEPCDMAKGVYLENQGPSLDVVDTFNIGLTAYEDKQYGLSIPWFNTTLANLLEKRTNPSIETVISFLQQSQANTEKEGPILETKKLKLASLLRVLNGNSPQEHTKEILNKEMRKVYNLCAKMDRKYPKPSSPSNICLYRHMLLPYYRIGEEIISLTPYVSLIYNITRKTESTAIQKLASRQLFRAEVYDAQGSNQSDYRTSHVSFIGESESQHLASLSTRISHITGLECVAHPHGYLDHQSAGEKYQIVNYGIGGHYSVHLDTYEGSYSDSQQILKTSGNRIATVLIYLTKVEAGGSTVFPWLDIAVPPVQHSALFWYNIDMSGTVDFRTRHAGCPVVVGDKWVTNKWILSHANTFTRPCGLNKTSNSRRIENIISNGYGQLD